MGQGFLKSPGKKIFLLLVFALYAGRLFAVDIETSIEPRSVSVGSAATLQIKVSGASGAEPFEIPRVNGLNISFIGTQSFSQTEIINWKKTTHSGIVLMFSVVPERSGTFTVPPFKIKADNKIINSTGVKFIAMNGATLRSGRGGSAMVKADISASKRMVYTGEPVILRYYLLHSGVEIGSKPAFEKLPDTKGCVQKQMDESIQDQAVNIGGIEYIKSFIAAFVIIPAEKGNFSIGGGSVIIAVNDPNEFFSFPRNQRLIFPALDIVVHPLPSAGKPERFNGDVGSFRITLEYGKEPVKAYEEKKIKARVSGRGNFVSLSRPYADVPEGVRVLCEDGKEVLQSGKDFPDGEKEYTYTFIAEKEGPVSIKGLSLNYFNPYTARYESARSGEINYNVAGGSKQKSGIDFEKDVTAENKIDINIFYIIGIILTVSGAIVFVVLWERKKYIIASGTAPESENKKQDEKSGKQDELNKKEMERALRRSDSNAFLRSAEKIINELERESRAGDAGDDVMKKIETIKSKIHLYKYAGGSITPGIMNEIYAGLNDCRK